jgi:hypothetical protein
MHISAERETLPRAWLRERGPRLLTVAVATWVVGWLLALLLTPDGVIRGRFDDGGVYYLAGRAYLHGQNYFASPDFRQWPLLAAVWAPVALLPPGLAMRGWMLLIMAALVGGVVLLLRRRDYFPERPDMRWLILAVAGPPTLDMLYLGQMSGACFAAYAAGLALLRRRPILAGCCFALMAAKPHLVLLALPALTTAELPAILAFAGAMLVWPVGSLLVAGPGVFRTFLVQLYDVRDSNVGLVTSSLSSLLPLKGGPHELVQAGLLLLLLAGCGVLAVRRLRGGRRLLSSGVDLATALALAALPYALVSDLLFLLPLLFRLGHHRRQSWALMLAWWAAPWLATLLTARGGGGMAALLPPLVALAGWRFVDGTWLRPATAAAGVGLRLGSEG